MVNVSVSRRYARALLEAAVEASHPDGLADQLESFAKAMQSNPDLSTALLDPAFTKEQRIGVIQAILHASGGAEPIFENFLKLLADRNRLAYVPDIARLYRDMTDVRGGRIRGKITSAVPLPPESLQKLIHSLERITQKNIVLETQVDPSVLGGVSAQVGSVIYDGTVKTELEDLKRTLLQH